MISSSFKRTKVFISYSHKDARYLDQLVEHLAYYERNNLIDSWSDKRIASGEQWREEIRRAIAATKVAVLLISPSFSASKFIAENELPPLLDAAEKEGAIILPVIVRPTNFEDTELSRFQTVNIPSMPLAKMKGYQRDDLWAKVVRDIKREIDPQLEAKLLVPSSSLLPSRSIGEEVELFTEIFHEKLKSERIKRKWKEEDLAKQFGYVTPQDVYRWEKGEAEPCSANMEWICKIFEKTPQEMGMVLVWDEIRGAVWRSKFIMDVEELEDMFEAENEEYRF